MLFVDERGKGDPVVLLHSGGMSSRQWRALSEKLGASHHVLAPDFLGSGKNPPWPNDKAFAWTEDLDGVVEVLARLDRPAHVVGHSYGGLIALGLARLHSARVRSVAVYDPVAFGVLYDPPDETGLADLARAEEIPVFTDQARGGGEEWWEAFVGYWNGEGAWKNLPPASREQFLRVGRKVFLEVMSLMHDRTPAMAYAKVDVPALLLSGEHTPIAARRVTKILSETMPNAKLEIVAAAGHMGPLTHSAEVNRLVEEHVRSAAKSR